MSSDLYSFGTTFHSHSTSELDGTQDLPFLSDSFPFFNTTSSNSFDEPLLPSSLDPFSPSFFSFSTSTDQNLTSYHQTNETFSDFDLSQVKNEESSSQISVDYYNNNQFLPHSYSGAENASKYMQRSFSSNSFEKKPSFQFQTHRDNPMDSSKFQMHDLSSTDNSLRRVCSTGDLQNMKENNMSPTEGNLQEESNFKVGRYNAEERKEKISKYRAKRTQRNFNKTIKYACRKTLADNRPRVRGRFARNDEPNEIPKVPCRDEDEVDFWMEELRLYEDDVTVGAAEQYLKSNSYGVSQFQYFGL
ncbi:putative zinc finger protein CONSTANS-LIKE 11 [Vicia villosa]|uniref:putative zinc finger protein CONSTANS-LIKE 11 n=1 Tax=Vicia villosa TaxID=3911 RepID=UPI00273CCEC1|nr:putative zinc finger protein CONSTANS-LIKE 11 [Vicia villosa]